MLCVDYSALCKVDSNLLTENFIIICWSEGFLYSLLAVSGVTDSPVINNERMTMEEVFVL